MQEPETLPDGSRNRRLPCSARSINRDDACVGCLFLFLLLGNNTRPHQRLHVAPIRRLHFKEVIHEQLKAVEVFGDELLSASVGFLEKTRYLLVDRLRRGFRVILLAPDLSPEVDLLLVIAERLEPERATHAVSADHSPCQVGRHLDVLRSSGGKLARELLLGNPPRSRHHQHILHLGFGAVQHVALGERHRGTQRPPTRDNRYLVQRLGVLQEHLRQSMTALVPRGDPAVAIRHHVRTPLAPPEDLIASFLQVGVRDGCTLLACSEQRRLVEQVR